MTGTTSGTPDLGYVVHPTDFTAPGEAAFAHASSTALRASRHPRPDHPGTRTRASAKSTECARPGQRQARRRSVRAVGPDEKDRPASAYLTVTTVHMPAM